MTETQGYTLALLLEDAAHEYPRAGQALAELRAALGPDRLEAIDLVFRPPATLVSMLHLAGGTTPERVLLEIKAVLKHGHLRLMSAAEMEIVEQHAAFEDPHRGLIIREEDIHDFEPALERFRRFIKICQDPAAVIDPTHAVRLSMHFMTGDQLLSRFERARHFFIESEAQLDVGQSVRLCLSTGSGQGPIELSAHVVQRIARNQSLKPGERPGFSVGLLLPPAEHELFESFLIAVRQGARWPDESGRRHERFAIQLRVAYQYRDEVRREQSEDVSRGGLFVYSFDPPPLGTVLGLSLQAPGAEEPVELQAKVVNVKTAEDAAADGSKAGFGVAFTEEPEVVRPLVEQLLLASATPRRRLALIADDDRFFRSVLGSVLGLGGFEVAEAPDGESAVKQVLESSRPFDIVVADLYMPGLTGIELIDRLRRVERLESPIVLVSGAELNARDIEAMRHLGADDVLSKTLTPEQMLERFEDVLGRRHAS